MALNEEDVLEMRLEYIGIGNKEDYLNQYIKTSEGYVLAGIRHFSGQKEKPFIYIWPSFEINNINMIIKDIKPFFEIFKPKSISFWVRPNLNTFQGEVFQQRYIGRTSQMKNDDLKLYKPEEYYD